MKSLFALLMVISTTAFAEDFIDVTFHSYHYDRSLVAEQGLNEHNIGIGFERDMGDTRLMVGEYHNSYYKNSVYAIAGYTPIHVGNVSVGVAAGAITGYNSTVVGLAAALVSVDYKSVGVNILAVPSVTYQGEYYSGFAGFQMRFKL